MARTGGYRGKGQYGTAAHTGGTLDPSMRARGVPDSVVRQGPQAVLAWRQANTAAPAPGRKSAADAAASVTAMMRGGSPPTGAALVKAASDVGVTPQPETVAAPMNSAEDRYINRARATSDPRSDAELRAAYHRNMAALKDRQAKSAAAKPAVETPAPAPAVAPAAKSAKPVSAKRQAAIDAYSKAHGKAPPARMSIARMKDSVDLARVATGRQAARREQVAGIFGAEVSQAKANAAGAAARAKFDAKLDVGLTSRIAQQDAMMDRLLTGEQRLAEIAARRSGKASAAKPSSELSGIGVSPRSQAAAAAGTPALPTSRGGPSNGDLVRNLEATAMGAKRQVRPAAAPPAVPPQNTGLLRQAGDMYAKAAPYIGTAGLVWQAMGAYNRARNPDGVGGNKTRREALYEAGKAVAPGLAMAALATVSKTAGKLILPVSMAWSAAQGAREDQGSMLRGAVRGAVRALDPTQMFMERGLGERAVDATLGSMPKPQAPSLWNQKLSPWQQGSAFGPPMQHGRLTEDQKRQFAAANASFAVRQAQAATAKAEAAKEKGARGWANPAVQMAAQQARGVENVTDWAAQGQDFIGKQHLGMG